MAGDAGIVTGEARGGSALAATAPVRQAGHERLTAGPGLPGGESAGLELARLRSRGRLRGVVALLGPAFVAAVAYVDPGNFATNFSAGAAFGYSLAWVIVLANLMAMLVQYLSAKVGVRSEEHTSELQSHVNLVCRLLLEKKKIHEFRECARDTREAGDKVQR